MKSCSRLRRVTASDVDSQLEAAAGARARAAGAAVAAVPVVVVVVAVVVAVLVVVMDPGFQAANRVSVAVPFWVHFGYTFLS